MLAQARRILMGSVVVATAGVMLFPERTMAQGFRGFDFGLSVGGYFPTGTVPTPFLITCLQPSEPCEVPSLTESQTVTIGGRVTAWLGSRGAIEMAGWYGSSSLVDQTQYTTEHDSFDGQDQIVLASLRAVVKVVTMPAMSGAMLLTAGPAVIHRFGDAWASWNDPTSGGGVVGISLNVQLAQSLGFRASVEDYLYSLSVGGPQVIPSTFRQDVVLSFSIGPSVRWGTHR